MEKKKVLEKIVLFFKDVTLSYKSKGEHYF